MASANENMSMERVSPLKPTIRMALRAWWRLHGSEGLKASVVLAVAGAASVVMLAFPAHWTQGVEKVWLLLAALGLYGLAMLPGAVPWRKRDRARIWQHAHIYVDPLAAFEHDFAWQMKRIRLRVAQFTDLWGEPIPTLRLPGTWEECKHEFKLESGEEGVFYGGLPVTEMVNGAAMPVYLMMKWHIRWHAFPYRIPRDRAMFDEFRSLWQEMDCRMSEIDVFDLAKQSSFSKEAHHQLRTRVDQVRAMAGFGPAVTAAHGGIHDAGVRGCGADAGGGGDRLPDE